VAAQVDPHAIRPGGGPADAVKQGVADLGLMGLIIRRARGFGFSMTPTRGDGKPRRHDASVAISRCHQSIG